MHELYNNVPLHLRKYVAPTKYSEIILTYSIIMYIKLKPLFHYAETI